eukprot:m.257844 g.257844  ORF g.257844 m.257844 type:complete len:103 (-) comp21090_c0_seq1:226-534(-)
MAGALLLLLAAAGVHATSQAIYSPSSKVSEYHHYSKRVHASLGPIKPPSWFLSWPRLLRTIGLVGCPCACRVVCVLTACDRAWDREQAGELGCPVIFSANDC